MPPPTPYPFSLLRKRKGKYGEERDGVREKSRGVLGGRGGGSNFLREREMMSESIYYTCLCDWGAVSERKNREGGRGIFKIGRWWKRIEKGGGYKWRWGGEGRGLIGEREIKGNKKGKAKHQFTRVIWKIYRERESSILYYILLWLDCSVVVRAKQFSSSQHRVLFSAVCVSVFLVGWVK